MKLILCVLSLSTIALFLLSVQASHIKAKYNSCYKKSEQCVNSTQATSDDADSICDIKKKGRPLTKNGKCLLECMMRQAKVMADDGFQEIEFMKIMNMRSDNKDFIEAAQDIANECKNKRDPNNDKCETAFLIDQCIHTTKKGDKF